MTRAQNLSIAYNDYQLARNRDAERLAYFKILFYGGHDGFPPTNSSLRAAFARWLRILALWIEKR